ncbi:MAG: copper/silver-translocating P-type ATPase [Acidobacteria bacterium]|nr:copper/silver-translocating P-type ATPase [Acidobacteriota bacterium]
MTRSTTTATVLDPVCGMTIDPATAAGSSTFNGETIHFCSRSCKTSFDAAPEKYAGAAEQPVSSCCGGNACHSR